MATADGYASANAATKPKCITKTLPLAVYSPVAVCQRAGSLVLKISKSSNNIYMNNERPTPETDAAARKGAYLAHGEYPETCGKQLVHIDFARKLERERDAIAAALQETLALLNHSDTSYPSQEGWWSYEKARELEALIPQNATAHSQKWRERGLDNTQDKMDKLERERDDTPWHSNGETKDEWFARQREKYIVLKRERNEATLPQ